MRNLRWLGFRVPLANVNKAHQANQLYPFAISLKESVRTYGQTLKKVCDLIRVTTYYGMVKKLVFCPIRAKLSVDTVTFIMNRFGWNQAFSSGMHYLNVIVEQKCTNGLDCFFCLFFFCMDFLFLKV